MDGGGVWPNDSMGKAIAASNRATTNTFIILPALTQLPRLDIHCYKFKRVEDILCSKAIVRNCSSRAEEC
jgi:hypothetical protein